MDARRIAAMVAACVLCLGFAVCAFADEPGAGGSVDADIVDAVGDAPSDADSEESPDSETEALPSEASAEDGSTQDSEPPASLMSDEPFEVIIVDDLTDVSSYTVWDKPFNDYSPTEAFTFLLFVFAVLSGMVKFITWAWL